MAKHIGHGPAASSRRTSPPRRHLRQMLRQVAAGRTVDPERERLAVRTLLPLVSNVNVKRGLGRGLGLRKDNQPLSAPLSSSSFHQSPSFHSDDDVPTKTEWLLHKDAQSGPVDLPPKVQAVADFFAKVHSLRVKSGEGRPVPFGCEWVGGHVGMSKATVWRALRILESEGVLKRMAPLPGRGKKGVDTYLPGGERGEAA